MLVGVPMNIGLGSLSFSSSLLGSVCAARVPSVSANMRAVTKARLVIRYPFSLVRSPILHRPARPGSAWNNQQRWLLASDSRRHRPATCTSAAPAPRCSTSSSPGGTAARSCCASRTPTSSARRPRWSRNSRRPALAGARVGRGPGGRRTARAVLPVRAARSLPRRGRTPRDRRPRVLLLLHAGAAAGRARRGGSEAAKAGSTTAGACRSRPSRSRSSRRRTQPRAIRFRVPPGKTTFDDLVHGPIAFDNANIEDFVDPALRRRAHLPPLRRRATTSTWRSRTSCAATITSRTRRSSAAVPGVGRRDSRASRTCRSSSAPTRSA